MADGVDLQCWRKDKVRSDSSSLVQWISGDFDFTDTWYGYAATAPNIQSSTGDRANASAGLRLAPPVNLSRFVD